jgi:hypothetical protein
VAKQVLQAVTLLNNAMHEGANLSGFATNYSKVKGNPELEQLLASQTRRLAGDLSQTGSSPAQQWLARTVMFENPALQGLSEIARKYKDQPITTLANMLTVLTVGTAVQYLTLANDPKARERYQNMTDQERARTIIVPGLAPGGVDVSVRPEYRLLWGPNTAIMDQVSGLNTGQIDTNWADALHTWATSGNSDLTNYSLGQRMDYAFDSVNPLNLTSSPWGNAAMSAAGFDSTMSRYTGDAKPFLPQRLDPALGDVENPGDIMSTRAMHVTQSLFGAQIEHVIRSMGAYNWVVHHDGSMMDGIKAAADSLAHDEVRSTGFMRQVLFGNTPEVQGINTPEDALWFKQEQGLKDAMTFLKEDVKNAGVAGGDPRYKYYRDIDYTKDEYLHTEGAVVGSIAAGLDRSLEPARKELADLNDQIRTNIPSKVHSTQDQKTLEINEKNVRRRALIDYMQHTAEGAAQQIRDTIGDPSFNWQNSDITKYGKIPWPPPPPPPQAPQAQAPTPVGAPQ